MSGADSGHTVGDAIRNGLVTAGVFAATSNFTGGAPPSSYVEAAPDAVQVTAVEGLTHDAGEIAEVAADGIRQRDEVAKETEPLPDDPPGEYRDAEPDPFGPEYMRDAEAFADDGVDGEAVDAVDSVDTVDAAPEASGDMGPDSGMGGLA